MENDGDTKFDDGIEAGESYQSPPPTPAEPAAKPEPPDPARAPFLDRDAHCPNCNEPGIRKGKVIVCEKCDAAFRFTKEGPKLDELGPFDKLENRVAVLEGKEAAEAPAVPAEPLPAEPIEDDGI